MNKANIQIAINAIREGSAKEILGAVATLTDTERLVVELVLDLTTPAPKAKRGRPEGTRNKPKVAPIC